MIPPIYKRNLKVWAIVIAMLLCYAHFLYADGEEKVIESDQAKLILDSNEGWNIPDGDTLKVIYTGSESDASALLRDSSGNASYWGGTFWSNYRVLLVNPNGITFGANANIQAASFIASTLNISNDDFLNDRYNFYKVAGRNAFIINRGNIIVRNGGYVALLSQAVENKGVILANLGTVVLAGGEKMTLALDDINEISVVIDEAVKDAVLGENGERIVSAVKNSGTISANGGKVILTAKVLNNVFDYAINNTGIIEAKSVVNHNGVIELVASGAPIVNTGTLEAGAIKVNAQGSEFINKGKVIAGSEPNLTDSGKIAVWVGSLVQGGLISADKIVTVEAERVDVVLDGPLALEIDPFMNTSPGVIIQAPEVKIIAKQFGSSAVPVNINAALTYIYRTQGDINILESLGIGTSVLLRGPPDGFGAIVYHRNTNLTLQADQVNLVGSAPTYLYGNITFSNFTCTVPAKEIYFEAGKTYIILSTFKIQGAEGGLIKLISSQEGSQWYIDPQGPRDITYAWVKDSYNLSPEEVYMTQSTNRGSCYNWDAVRTWSGETSNAWNVAGNWLEGIVPVANDDLVFPDNLASGRYSTNNNITAGTAFSSITIQGSGYTLAGNQIALGVGGITTDKVSGTNTISLNISLGATRTITVTNSGETLTISGVISGAGGLTKAGAGSLILTRNNTYTGATNVTAGILNIQNAGALGTTDAGTTVSSGASLEIQGGTTGVDEPMTLNGTGISNAGALRNISGANSITGVITLGSATRINSDAGTLTIRGGITGTQNLTIGGASNVTVNTAAIATGTGTLTKDGNGTLTFDFANTYTGLTTINAGSLTYSIANAISSGDVTVSGGTLNIAGFSDTVGAVTLTSGTITGAAGILTATSYTLESGTVSAILGGVGVTLTKNTAGTVTLTKANTYTGATNITAGILNIQNNSALGTTDAGTTVSSGATLQIQNTTAVGAEALTITGNGYNGAGALENVSTNNSWAGVITLGNPGARINSDSGTLTISGGVVGGGYALTVGGAGDVTFTTAAIAGTGTTLTKDGAGTLTLSFANTYTGLTTVNAGTLYYNTNDALASGDVTVSGGTLDIAGRSDTVGAVTLTSGTITGGAGVLTSTSYTVESGTISAILGGTDVTLTKNTAGTVILSKNNTYTGITTISAGTLQIGDNTTTGTLGAGAVTNNASLVFNRSNALTVSNIISGTGSLTQVGSGTLTLSGANTYTGTTTISKGTISANNIVVSGGSSNLGNATSAVILGNGSNTGTLSYTGNSATYTRGFTINAGGGEVDTTTNGQTLTISGDITNGGAFTIGGAGDTTILSAISGAGSLTKAGSGTLTLSGNNTYSGGTTLGGTGTLNINSATALGTGTLTIAGGKIDNTSGGSITLSNNNAQAWNANFTFTGTNNLNLGTGAVTLSANRTVTVSNSTLTVGGVISGDYSLTKQGNGTLTLSGVNTYSGTTTIGAGILSIAADSALGTAPGSPTAGKLVFSGATLQTTSTFTLNSNRGIALTGSGTIEVASGTTLTYGGIITGGAALTKTGTGTLTLSGINTYSNDTTVSAGIINIQNNSSLGTTAGTTSVASGAAIQIDGSGLTIAEPLNTLIGTGVSSGGALRNLANNNTWTGAITLGAGGATINSDSGTLTISGAIGGNTRPLTIGGAGNVLINGAIGTTSGALTKNGSGTLTLFGDNTYTGLTTVNAGTLQYGGNNLNAEDITVSGGILDIAGYSHTVGTITLISGTITGGSGVLTSNADYAVQSGTISAILGGGVGLTKTTNGIVTITKANTYTGTTAINGGVLNIQNASALGTTDNGTTVASGAALQLQGGITVTGEALILNGSGVSTDGALRNISGNNTWTGNITLGANSRINSDSGTLTISGGISGLFDLTVGGAGNVAISGVIGTGANTLTKDGAGTLTLSGANTYSGGTTVSAGTLNVNYATALGSGTLTATAVGNTVNYTLTGDQTIKSTTYHHLTISGSGTKTLGGAITINGDFTVSSGIFDPGVNVINGNATGTLTVGNNATIRICTADSEQYLWDGPTVFEAGSTVEYKRDDVQTINQDLSYQNLTFSGSNSTKTLGGAITVNGNLTINSGVTLDVSGNNYGITVGGNWSNSGTFTPGSGTVTFNKSSGTQTLNSGGTGADKAFYNLTHNGTGTLQLVTNDIVISNNFTTSGGFPLSGTFNANGRAMSVGGNWTTSYFTANGNTVTFNGGGTQDLASGGVHFYNFTVNKSAGTLVMRADILVDNNLEITNGTLDMSVSTFSITLGGNWVNSGTFNAGPGTVYFNGTTTVSGSSTTTFNNVTINNGATLTGHSTNMNVRGSWTNNGTFTHNSGTVNLNGTSNQNVNSSIFNNLTLNNTGAGGSDRIIISGNIDVNGTLTITDGTLDLATNNPDVYIAGDVLIGLSGAVTKGSGTWIFDGTTNFKDSTNPTQDIGAANISGAVTVDATGNGMRVEILVINEGYSLDISNTTLTITSSDSEPFTNSGTFTTTGSTVVYTGSDAEIYVAAVDYHNLTLAPASNDSTDYYLYEDATLTGNLTINTYARLDTDGYNIRIAGNWINNGTFNHGSATVTFNGSDSQYITSGGSSFYNLTNNNPGVLTLLLIDTLNVDGDLTLEAGSVLDAQGETINISGNWINNGGTFDSNGGTVTFNKGAAQEIKGTATTQTFNHLTTSGAGTSLSVSGSTGTIVITGNLTIGLDTSFTSPIASPNEIQVSGNWIQNGTFNHNNGSVQFYGDGAGNTSASSTISGSAEPSFNKLYVNSGHTLTARAGNMNVSTIFANNGTFDANGGTVTFNGTVDMRDSNDVTFNNLIINSNQSLIFPSGKNITFTGNFTNSGTFVHGSSTLIFSGAGPQTLTTGGADANRTFYKIIHSGRGTLTLSGNLALANDLTNSGGSWLSGANTIDINGNFNNSANFTAPSTTMNVQGNFANSGTFTHNSGTVIFDSTTQSDITGDNTFYNLTINTATDGAKTVRFGAGDTQTITNNLVITGAAGKVLTIRSTSDGTQAILNIPASISSGVNYVDVKDNKIDGTNTIAPQNSVDSGNNTNWSFISKIAFTTSVQNISAGVVSGIMTIQTQNASGTPTNVSSNTTIDLTSTSGSGKFYNDAAGNNQITSVTIANGTNSASFYYKDTTTGTPTLTASENPSQGWTDATQTETITPAALKNFTVTGITNLTAGDLNSAVVTAYDLYDNIKTDYTGTAHFSSTDSQAVLPADYTYQPADNGAHTFTNGVQLKTANSQTVTVADGTKAGSQTVTVQPAAANKLVWDTQPASPVNAGATWAAFKIKITDQYGNTRTADTTAITITPSAGSFASGTTTQNTVNGIATFNDITYTVARTIAVSGSAMGLTVTPASNNITINPAGPSTLVFIQQPTDATAGSAIAPALKVEIKDAYDNLRVADSTSTITISLQNNPGSGALSGTLTQNTSQGVATFSGLAINKAGSGYTLKAASGDLTVISDSFSIAANPSDSQLSNAEVVRASIEIGLYQFTPFIPGGGAGYLYHPITPTDTSAFDQFMLQAGDYSFLDGVLNYTGNQELTPFFEELDKKGPR